MIIKSYELNKINNYKCNLYLFYGENEGYKNDIIKNYFLNNSKEDIFRYEEKEILNDKFSFFNNIFTKSFFEEKKLFIISRITDKFNEIVEEVLEKKVSDIKIILNASSLEKKSKLRKLFEKNKDIICINFNEDYISSVIDSDTLILANSALTTDDIYNDMVFEITAGLGSSFKDIICIPFYEDNAQTLRSIAINFFKLNKILISQETINLIIERSRGDRGNLKNELNKIELYMKTHKNINTDEILKITNLAENYDVSELLNSCLSKNTKKTINILNENNFTVEDCILIIRSLSIKLKRLYKIHKEYKENKNLDSIISSYKPPIFWKDKDIIKQQINKDDVKNIENMIFQTNDIELLIKKNSDNAVNIMSDFIITNSKQSSNGL